MVRDCGVNGGIAKERSEGRGGDKYALQFCECLESVSADSEKEKDVRASCCFDYFKVAFYWDWRSVEPEDFRRTESLFRILHLDMTAYDSCHGDQNFASKVIFFGDTYLAYSPLGNLPAGVKEYFVIEMTGSACRSFEDRGGDWKELIDFVFSVDHHVTRVDLAMDDMTGIVPLEDGDSSDGKGLKSRCRDMEFVSNFRSPKTGRLGSVNYNVDPPDSSEDRFDTPRIIDDPKGWSITFGKVNSIQLQLYDKLMERLAKGVHTTLDSWVRFEMRFGSERDRAESVLLLCKAAFEEGLFGVLCGQLLRWLIDFKDIPDGFEDDRNHYYRFDSWRPFDLFIGGVVSNPVPANQSRNECSVTKSVSWIMNQWAKTCVTLCKISPKFFLSVLANSMRTWLKKHPVNNAIEGQVNDYFLKFSDRLGTYDKDASNKGLWDFIDGNTDKVVTEGSDSPWDDSESDSDGSDVQSRDGVYGWDRYKH